METLLLQTTNLPMELLRFIVLPMAWDSMTSEEVRKKFIKDVIPQFMVQQAIRFKSFPSGCDAHSSVGVIALYMDQTLTYSSRYFRKGCLSDIFAARSNLIKESLPSAPYFFVCYTNEKRVVVVSDYLT